MKFPFQLFLKKTIKITHSIKVVIPIGFPNQARQVGFLLPLIFFAFSIVNGHAQQTSHVSITVSNLEKSAAFFKNILSFSDAGTCTISNKDTQLLFGIKDPKLKAKGIKLKLGDEYIELVQFISTVPGKPIPVDSKSNDVWFQHIAIVVSNMDSAYSILKRAKVTHVSTFPQTLPDYIAAAAGIKAFYFRDPDGHNLELIYFPPGKGNPKWQGHPNLFLGIDHTAFAVLETEKSLPFYTTLGFTVAGHSENYGTEQEHLNQVFGARLWITGLRGIGGFGVEFLEYIAPPGGRPYAKEIKVTDLVYWHTAIRVNDLEKIFSQLQKLKYQIVSKGIVSVNIGNDVTEKMLLMRDADGHFVLLFE